MDRIPQGERLSRRDLLKAGIDWGFKGAAVFLVGCSTGKSRNFPAQEVSPTLVQPQLEPDRFEPIVRVTPTLTVSKEMLDTAYIHTLLRESQIDRSNRQSRIDVVRNNLYVIITNQGTSGTALRIDESGYYLTVAHVASEPNAKRPATLPPVVYHPTTGIGGYVSSMIYDLEHDIALVYAPSGEEKKPVPGLLLNPQINPGSKLWLYGYVEFSGSVYLGIVNGVVQSLQASTGTYTKGHILVEGMKPFGTSSGGPILDGENRVVAVESGAIRPADSPLSRESYTAATVVPVRAFIDTLARSPVVSYMGLE